VTGRLSPNRTCRATRPTRWSIKRTTAAGPEGHEAPGFSNASALPLHHRLWPARQQRHHTAGRYAGHHCNARGRADDSGIAGQRSPGPAALITDASTRRDGATTKGPLRRGLLFCDSLVVALFLRLGTSNADHRQDFAGDVAEQLGGARNTKAALSPPAARAASSGVSLPRIWPPLRRTVGRIERVHTDPAPPALTRMPRSTRCAASERVKA